MRVLSLRVLGFQSFADSGEVEFDAGVNLIVGQNNSGKSAFLKAMRGTLPDDRHRNEDKFRDFSLPPPKVQLDLECSGSELSDALLRRGGERPVWVPVASSGGPDMIRDLLARPVLTFPVSIGPDSGFDSRRRPSHGLPQKDSGFAAEVVGEGGAVQIRRMAANNADTLIEAVQDLWKESMFYFSAERYAIGKSMYVHVERLQSDARNLPAVLQTLQHRRGTIFERLKQHVREIFPTVGNISVGPVPGNDSQTEIRVWPTEQMMHPELSFPLENSGTGVAQVVALLAAIMTMDRAVIIIDEINSFLHPAAAKALLRIIQTHYDQHQYIVSTHSPEVIGFSNPRRIHLVRKSGYESSVSAVQLGNVEAFREIGSHLGISMSDVFAADRVIWLEGQTEELCFPYLYTELVGPLPSGLLMVAVVATGDFLAKRRDRQMVYEIYSRLSAASCSLEVPVVFSFDAEDLSDEEMVDMRRQSNDRIHFLPRRNFESYLIDADAIAAFIGKRDSEGAPEPVAVAAELSRLAQSSGFTSNAPWNGSLDDETWLAKVDGARLIARTVESLTDSRVTFAKKQHSLQLLKYLLDNKRGKLSGLRDYAVGLVDAAAASPPADG